MEPDFWHDRWASGRLGFHEGRPNDLLVAHADRLGLPNGARVAVPLCGKAVDLRWFLERGQRVVGIELDRRAVAQFFAEVLEREPTVTSPGAFECWSAEGLEIFVGDFFEMGEALLGPVDAVYDRAALVALPAPMRERYAGHLTAITAGAPQLLVTFEYDNPAIEGPPFSVDEAEVTRLYGERYMMKMLERRDVPGGLKGHSGAEGVAWVLTPRRTSEG